ncbi:hypothetical protein B0J17DRAFT_634216, partial [Rhizoctonia solani]
MSPARMLDSESLGGMDAGEDGKGVEGAPEGTVLDRLEREIVVGGLANNVILVCLVFWKMYACGYGFGRVASLLVNHHSRNYPCPDYSMQPLQRGPSGYRPPHARPPIVSPRSLTSASTTGTTPSDPLSRIPPLSNGRAPALSRGRLLLSVNRVQNSTPNGDALAVESRSSLPLVPKIETRVTPKHTSTTLRMESIFVEQQNERLAKGQAEKEKAAKKQRINKERKVQEAKRTAEEQAIGEKAEDKPKEETEQKSHKK